MNIRREQLPSADDLAPMLAPALAEAGQALIAQIHMRALRGVGVDDAEMPRYAASTVASKKRRGRDATTRTLTESGSMLRSIHVVETAVSGSRASVVIGFSNTDDARKAAHNQRIAPWFGASPKDTEVVGKLLTARIGELLEDDK